MAFISQIIQQHPDAGYWHQQYPWFSIGQLVHAANHTATPAFTESARRTAVFFNDIPRLHWLLFQEETDVAALHSLVYPEKIAELQNEPATTGTTTNAEITNKPVDSTDTAINEIPVPENATNAVMVPVADVAAVNKNTDETATESITSSPSFDADEASGEPSVTNDNAGHRTTGSVFFTRSGKSESATEEQEDNEKEEPDLLPLHHNRLSVSLAQAADSYKNSSVDDDSVVFKTAYQHTIDYFASQGIQLDSEPARDDRFGQQLKTFTSWLRQMKRLPDAPVPEADPLVESQAAHSLQKGEVVTEPMADVLLKQGKKEQAITVLEKLRLLHPQKSHYFAARIDQLKHI